MKKISSWFGGQSLGTRMSLILILFTVLAALVMLVAATVLTFTTFGALNLLYAIVGLR